MRSVDGPEGILEGDRYKHKGENEQFSRKHRYVQSPLPEKNRKKVSDSKHVSL